MIWRKAGRSGDTNCVEVAWRKASGSGAQSNCVEVAWRKASGSGAQSNCVEVAWRKASGSGAESNCVELANTGAVRDSKHPAGPSLAADLRTLMAAVKAGRLDR